MDEDIFEDEGSACEEFFPDERLEDEQDWLDAGDSYEETGKQFYSNPKGICEDALCCGCCGMF